MLLADYNCYKKLEETGEKNIFLLINLDFNLPLSKI